MPSFPFASLLALASLVVPALGLLLYSLLLFRISPYFRNVFLRSVGMKGRDKALKYISLGLANHIFVLMMALSVVLSLVLEGIAFLLLSPPMILIDEKATTLASLVIAGPIEESMKLLAASVAFSLLFFLLSWKKTDTPYGRLSPTKNGILLGIFAGGSFGVAESVLYLFTGFTSLASGDLSATTIDAVVWRMLLGVLVHAVYSGIAASGLGRSGWGDRTMCTVMGLVLAILFHSINNGIAGVMQLYSGLEIGTMVIATDVSQSVLFIIALSTLIVIWKGSERKSGTGRSNASNHW